MKEPRSIRLWKQNFSIRKDAPPKGWHVFLRTAWLNGQWHSAYLLYLDSWAWKQRRLGAIRRADGKCQTCGNGGLFHVHHVTYERVGAERADDLRVLCVPCHKLRHSVKRGQQPIKMDPTTRRRRERSLGKPLPVPPEPEMKIRRRPKGATSAV